MPGAQVFYGACTYLHPYVDDDDDDHTASVALVTAVSMAPAPQEAAVSIAGAETARDRAALKRPTQLACLLACLLA